MACPECGDSPEARRAQASPGYGPEGAWAPIVSVDFFPPPHTWFYGAATVFILWGAQGFISISGWFESYLARKLLSDKLDDSKKLWLQRQRR